MAKYCSQQNDIPIRPMYLGMPAEHERTTQLGIYNGDFARGADLLVKIAANYYLYRKFFQARVANTLDMLEQHNQEIIDWLKKIDREHIERPSWLVRKFSMFSKSEYYKFEKCIKENSRLVGYNPFNKHLLKPLLINFGATELSTLVKESMLKTSISKEESWNYYENRDGGVRQIDGLPPLSVISALTIASYIATFPLSALIFVPGFLMYSYTNQYYNNFAGNSGGLIRDLTRNQIFGNCPEWVRKIVFSKAFSVARSALVLGLSAKYMDCAFNELWINHVFNNRKKLLNLLIAYKKLKKEVDEHPDNKEAELQFKKQKLLITKFISDGHTIKSIIPFKNYKSWTNLKNKTAFRYSWKLLAIALVAYNTIKLGHYILS